jgi:DNA-binding XRE family transcriptional regulator
LPSGPTPQTPMDKLTLSDWMRGQRALRDLTQEALAEEVGCAVQTIRAFENGWRRPSRQLAERIAQVLGLAPAERAAFLQAARAPIARSIAPAAAPATPAVADPASHLAELAQSAHARLYGPDQQRWLAQLDSELATTEAALAWALDEQSDLPAARVELALRALSASERFWHGRGHQAKGLRWLEQALDLVDSHAFQITPVVLAAALSSAGWLARIRGDQPRAVALLQRCVALYRTLGDAQGTSDALDTLGDLAIFEGDGLAATWFHEESLALRRTLGQPVQIALSLNGLGHAAVLRGYYERAAEHFQESLATLRAIDDRRTSAMALHGLGLARMRQGSLAEASASLAAALGHFQALDNGLDVALCLELIGELLALQSLAAGGGEQVALAAAQLWGASARLLDQAQVSLSPSELARRDMLIAAVRRRVGPAAFQASWAAGQALAQFEAVAIGLAALA